MFFSTFSENLGKSKGVPYDFSTFFLEIRQIHRGYHMVFATFTNSKKIKGGAIWIPSDSYLFEIIIENLPKFSEFSKNKIQGGGI